MPRPSSSQPTSQPPQTAQAPARRADAARNRDKILAAARTAFAEPEAEAAAEPEVSMAEIARRAGVGMATLYRNFPGRRELLEALFTGEVDALCAAAERAGRSDGERDGEGEGEGEGETPGAALLAWLHRFFAFATTKHHVATELLAHSDRSNPVFGESRARVLVAGRPLLTAAQRTHEIRDDLTLEQILDLVIALASINGDTGYVVPILQAVLDGLRPPSDGQPL